MSPLRTLACCAVVMVASIGASSKDALMRARQLYNQQQFGSAISAATEASRDPQLVDAATLILARARLELFRGSADRDDLIAAREALSRIHPTQLSPLDRLELTIGLGESLYLDDQPGAAAEEFELALARVDRVNHSGRERVLDWWASALDRQAQLGPKSNRPLIYARIVRRMEDELRLNSSSAVASYWLVAGTRGSGDLERAWAAAVAGWVRASRASERQDALLADLNRIVTEAIIPERARRTAAPTEVEQVSATMRHEWEALTQHWRPPTRDPDRPRG